MRILVIGGLGSIGSRYCSILEYLGHEVVVHDELRKEYEGIDCYRFDRAIIATPTITHYDYCKQLIEIGKPFLCEKPLSHSLVQCDELVELDTKKLGRVVCNYLFTFPDLIHHAEIDYDYFRTGPDGMLWDCCQLLYLDEYAILNNDSPVFTLTVSGRDVSIEAIEWGYIRMLATWIRGGVMWNMADGRDMTRRVLERLESERSHFNSSTH